MTESKDVHLKQLVTQYTDAIALNGISIEMPDGS